MCQIKNCVCLLILIAGVGLLGFQAKAQNQPQVPPQIQPQVTPPADTSDAPVPPVEDNTPQPGDDVAGKQLFRSTNWTATGFTCIHCHADFNEKKSPDGIIRLAHSLYNSGFRTLYYKWNRTTTQSLQEAIQACMIQWITPRKIEGYEGELPAQSQIRQLVAFLRSPAMIQESKAKPIEPMWIDTIPSDRTLNVGDQALGARTFRHACATCHSPEGTGPAPSLLRNGYSRYQIAKKIRNIDRTGLKGLMMPGFPLDRLSDREVINVATYVYQM